MLVGVGCVFVRVRNRHVLRVREQRGGGMGERWIEEKENSVKKIQWKQIKIEKIPST